MVTALLRLSLVLMMGAFVGCSLIRDSNDFVVDGDGGEDADRDAGTDATDAGTATDTGGCRTNSDCEPFVNAETECNDLMCELGTCNSGYADCDMDETTGCETPITANGNCGGCGVRCEEATPQCEVMGTNAMCVRECSVGTTKCGMDCVDTTRSLLHCGECDSACAGMNASQSCTDSMCVIDSCTEGFDDCDLDPDNGCEVDLELPTSCGGCGITCDAGISCLNQICDPYVEVAAAFDHRCARHESGAVDCWGTNELTEYGGTIHPAPSESPFRVRWTPPGEAAEVDFLARSVSVGRGHTCFVSSDPASEGVLHCMGDNGSIQGGRRVATEASPPQPVELRGSTTPAFVSVHSSVDHSCAIDVNGEVWCWGYNRDGQTGDTSQRFAVPLRLPSDAVNVAVSGKTTCVQLTDGSVHCLGANDLGQLGRGSSGVGMFAMPEPVLATSGASDLSNVTRLTAGTDEFCAIHGGSNQLVCWGWNAQGSIHQDYLTRTRPAIIAVGVSDVVQFHLGLCYVVSDGTHCRGRESEGQFGVAPTEERADGTLYSGLDGIVEMAGGITGGCGLRDGELVCWGSSAYGTIPRASLLEEPSPMIDTDSLPIANLTHFALSDRGSCGIRAGLAYCWGEGGRFESGDGISHPTPTLIPGLNNVIDIARGDLGVCAIRENGAANELWCWSNIHPLGHPRTPTLVPSVVDPTQIDMGFRHGCALRSGGEVMCWGINTSLQAGSAGDDWIMPTPVQLDGSPIIASTIATGFDFSCAILSGTDAGKVVCWGNNTEGQLGTASIGGSSLPVMSMATGAVMIEAGRQGVCILTDGNDVQCWGQNDHGQFGAAGSGPIITLPPIAGTDAVSVATGARSTCIAYADQTVRCVGNNVFGQLGMAGASSEDLVLVPGVMGTEVNNASNDSFANCAGHDGSWMCWGLNDFGKLGTDPVLHYAPTQIAR